MNNTIEEFVKEILQEINARIASWLGMYSQGVFYVILSDIWEWTGIRTKMESGIRDLLSRQRCDDMLEVGELWSKKLAVANDEIERLKAKIKE